LKEFFLTLLWVVFVIDAILLVLIVLLQSGRGGGISGMLGGGGGAESALGPKSGLNKITGWMAGIFFVTSVVIALMTYEKSAMDVDTDTVEDTGAGIPDDEEPAKEAVESDVKGEPDAKGAPKVEDKGDPSETVTKEAPAADSKAPMPKGDAGASTPSEKPVDKADDK